jgi:hypothetical protein
LLNLENLPLLRRVAGVVSKANVQVEHSKIRGRTCIAFIKLFFPKLNHCFFKVTSASLLPFMFFLSWLRFFPPSRFMHGELQMSEK